MATGFGVLGEFDSDKETWAVYTERVYLYFVANDIVDPQKKRAILLSSCGAGTYQLIRSLVAPDKPTDRSLDEIVKLVQDHHQPPPSVTVRRFAFHSRSRKNAETISDYVASLRELSEYCDFGGSLNDMLRDRLVCGVNDERYQRRLLSESKLTFEKAFELAQSMELADQNLRELRDSGSKRVNKVNARAKDRAEGQTSGHAACATYRGTCGSCYRCGGDHRPSECRFKNAECRYCHKKGHIARACRLKAAKHKFGKTSADGKHLPDSADRANYVEEEPLYQLSPSRTPPLIVHVRINGEICDMEVDTGAGISLMSEAMYQQKWSSSARPPVLSPAAVRIRTYTGETVNVLGVAAVTVEYEDQRCELDLHVVSGSGPSLLGRDWLQALTLNWRSLHKLRPPVALEDVLKRHSSVFEESLGLAKDFTAKIHVDASEQPRFCKARTVPYALRERVEQELDRLQRLGVIEPIQSSEWAAPIVPIVKRDGSIRICGDFKLTVNKATRADSYPLPRIEDIFARLSGGKVFSTLDLAHAYLQIPLDEDSQKVVVINTHRGLYRYRRLPFGVHSAPAIFQRSMECILQGLPHVSVYIDDVLIAGRTVAEHLETLEAVLTRLESVGLKLHFNKCSFMLPQVEYLGHVISGEGLEPSKEKLRAVLEAPEPKNTTQLRSLVGLINYYSKFLPQASTVMAPMYKLLKASARWRWGPQQRRAFEAVKKLLTSSKVLVHFDPARTLTLTCDASPYGVGYVLSHQMEDGTERPVAYASRSLTEAERKYAQLEKEALAIVSGVKKFHHYLYGRKFRINSDHKPLQYILSESRAVPAMASARLQRWALFLSAYDYSISYRPGKELSNADSLSRLPLPCSSVEAEREAASMPGELVLLLERLQNSPVKAADIKTWTNRDPILARVRTMVQRGWLETTEEALRPYKARQNELSVLDGCLLWGSRVVVPKMGRDRVLEELHDGHPGMQQMKRRARGVLWWPGLDHDIEQTVRNCVECDSQRGTPTKAPVHPWEWPARPWSRLHMDYAGPFCGKMFLVVVDAYSKWLEAVLVNAATSRNTIRVLRGLFATHGIPDMLVSDNGTPFVSAEFEEFTRRNGIRHLRSAPYHPATNGQAERAVQTVKSSLKKCKGDELEVNLARFLFRYRTTPHSTTGVSPAELLMNRQLQTHLDLLRPDLASRVASSQAKQKFYKDKDSRTRSYQVGDKVYAKSFKAGPSWLSGDLVSVAGPRSFVVRLSDGVEVRRHVDQIRTRSADATVSSNEDLDCDLSPCPNRDETNISTSPPEPTALQPEIRRSLRHSRPPDRLDPSFN